MKKRFTGFFKKLWKEESGASHMVEIILVIVIVLAVAALIKTQLTKSTTDVMTQLDNATTESKIDYHYDEFPDVI